MTEQTRTRNQRRTVTGTVTGSKADKTIKITIERKMKHPKYEKQVAWRNTLAVHDEKNEANEGDVVLVAQTRRLSKTKCWRLVKILRRAE